ncbi:MAG TPA: hypothetical protein VMF89_34075, partial [Polyangiales bacterium]|nr:hypothetical protein [Polyangiales bacterium]
LQPGLPIAIGGRNLGRAQQVATKLGGATAHAIDLALEGLGLPAEERFSALVLFVKDERLTALRYALQHGIPYIDISSAPFEIAPIVAFQLQQPGRSAVLLASHWLAGTSMLATLEFARDFEQLDRVQIGVVLDEQDVGGPAASADFERFASATTSSLILDDSRYRWLSEAESERDFIDVDGTTLRARSYSLLDVQSLGAATSARSVRLDLFVGESAGRRAGKHFSTEMIIELFGRDKHGRPARARHELSHPEGQAPVTALAVATAVEQLLGLDGAEPARPGLYTPDRLIDPATFMARLSQFGVQLKRGALKAA